MIAKQFYFSKTVTSVIFSHEKIAACLEMSLDLQAFSAPMEDARGTLNQAKRFVVLGY